MISNETKQSVSVSSGVRVIGNFRITDATQARIMMSLSDKIYTRKNLAVIREISTNMLDAQKEAGKNISECIISLPTLTDLNLKFRDFGYGLTEDQLINTYCVFGESTKRNSNDYVGLLGYGSKSPYAISDSFTVTSWVNGEKSIYQCVKGDTTKLHEALLLSRCVSDEPSGIEVCVPVKQDAIWMFHREACDFFKYWETLPNIINMDIGHLDTMTKFRNTLPTLKGECWNIRPKSDGNAIGIAFMGGVSYRIDWNVLSNYMSLTSKTRVLFDIIQNNDVTLFFKMGEVQFVDSRESLEYTELTLNAIKNIINSIFSKIEKSIQEKFTSATNLWDAKIIYNAIFGTGILELEEGESSDCITNIKILDGNLSALENACDGLFMWNTIPIHNASFSDLNKFDNASPTEIHEYNCTPDNPVMITYRRKKNRVKICCCNSEGNNTILASPQVAVVINDTNIKSGNAAIARYLIFGKNTNIRTVYILSFNDDVIKNNFYKHYNFESVPCIKLSEILMDAKAWVIANKVSNTKGSNSGSNTSMVRIMQYIDTNTWSIEEHNVPIREIENGGLFINESGVSRRGRRRWSHYNNIKQIILSDHCTGNIDEAVKNIKTISEHNGMDIDRIYIISKRTQKSVWFLDAVKSGNWISVWNYIAENISSDLTTLVNASNYQITDTLSYETAINLKDKIVEFNSPMINLINHITEYDHSADIKICDALKCLSLWNLTVKDTVATVDFSALVDEVKDKYPYIGNYLSPRTLRDTNELIDYVNAIDFYLKLNPKSEEVLELD